MSNVPNAEGTEGKQTEGDEGKVLQPGDEGYVPPAEPADDTLVVAIGADPSLGSDDADIDAPVDDAGTPPSELVKTLRRAAKDAARDKRKAEEERDAAIAAAAGKTAEPPAVVVGEKPTLESCEYDADKFEAALLAWNQRKQQADEAEKKRADEQQAQQTEYATRLTAYKTGAVTLKVKDFDEAERAVEAGLSKLQQSIIVKHAKNAALLVYALGKDATKLKELGAIKDPVAFGIAASNIEKDIKTVKRSEFSPEKTVTAGGGGLATGANALAKARAQAEKTGDYSEVNRLKREQREAERKQK